MSSEESQNLLGHIQNEGPSLFDDEKRVKRRRGWCSHRVLGDNIPRWLLILLIVLFGFATLFLSAWFAILPNLVDRIVEHSSLEFTSIHLNYRSSDSFLLTGQGYLINAGPFSATIFPTGEDPNAVKGSLKSNNSTEVPHGAIRISYESVELGYMFLPTVETVGGKEKNDLTIAGKVVTVTNKTKWDQFGQDLVVKDKLQWYLSGKINLRALGRTYQNVNFAKSVDISGFSGLKNVSITYFTMTNSNETNVNTKMVVAITQNSIVNIAWMGDLTMDLYYRGVIIGNGVAANAELHTGVTYMKAEGSIIATPESRPVLGPLLSDYLGHTDSPVTAKIVGCTNPLLRDSLIGVEFHTVLPADPTNLVKKLEFSAVDISPLDNMVVGMKSESVITILQLLGPNSPMVIEKVNLNVALLWGETVLGHLAYSTDVKGGDKPTFVLPINGNVTMVNKGTEWATFTEAYVARDNVTLSLKGEMSAVVKSAIGDLSLSGLAMESSVLLKGMSGLDNSTVQKLDLPRNARDGGIKIYISVVMNNPSVATMAMGDLPFLQIYKGEQIGFLVSKNVTLVPGPNYLNLEGSVVLPPKSKRGETPKEALQDFFNRYLAGKDSEVSVKGNADSSNPNIPTWVANVINSLSIKTVIPGTKDKIIQGLEILSLEMTIPGSINSTVDDGYVPFKSQVSSIFVSPFGFPLSTSEVSIQVSLLVDGKVAAIMEEPSDWLPSTSNQTLNQLNFTLTGVRFKVVDRELFSQLSAGLINKPTQKLVMSGTASAKVHTAASDLTLEGVKFDCPVELVGLDSFPHGTILMLLPNQGITGGYNWGLKMDVQLEIYNPSVVTLKVAGMTMDYFFDGVNFGVVTVYDVLMKPGKNRMVGHVIFNKATKDHEKNVMRRFLSNYSDGRSSPLVLRGNKYNAPLLVPGMLQLLSSTDFPGQPSLLLNKTTISLVPHINPFSFDVFMTFYNPFDIDFIYQSFSNFTVWQVSKKGEFTVIGHLINTKLNPSFVVPRNSYATLERPLKLVPELHVISIIESLLGSKCFTKGIVGAKMQDFGPVQVDFEQYFVASEKLK